MAEQRTALVTGANRGIGFEVCRQLAERGYRVILTARTRAKADGAARRLRADTASTAAPEVLDVTDARSVRALARALASRREHVDVLVNNAAILMAESHDIVDRSIDDFRTTFETNVFVPSP
jgi:NAD(P)-dependent dehydrogenase (short-subunit alcohol dehydrogenase family)